MTPRILVRIGLNGVVVRSATQNPAHVASQSCDSLVLLETIDVSPIGWPVWPPV